MSGFVGKSGRMAGTRLRTFERETPSLKSRRAALEAEERLKLRAEFLAKHEEIKEQARERRKAEIEAARPINRALAKVKGIFRKIIGR